MNVLMLWTTLNFMLFLIFIIGIFINNYCRFFTIQSLTSWKSSYRYKNKYNEEIKLMLKTDTPDSVVLTLSLNDLQWANTMCSFIQRNLGCFLLNDSKLGILFIVFFAWVLGPPFAKSLFVQRKQMFEDVFVLTSWYQSLWWSIFTGIFCELVAKDLEVGIS